MRVLLLTLAISVLSTARLGAQAGAIEGTVVNEATGAPVAHALVWMVTPMRAAAPRNVSVYTDGEGRFRVENLEAGPYQMMARKGGFVDAMSLGQSGVALQLASGERKSGVTLKLTPQAILSGRVLDEFGEPAQGAMVQAYSARQANGKQTWSMTRSTVTTDDRGMFRLLNLSPGRYVVGVQFQDRLRPMPGGGGQADTYAPTYYPKALDAAEAQPVEVVAGSEKAGIEIRLQRVAAYQVRGRVIGRNGEAPTGFSVMMRQRGLGGEPGGMSTAVRTGQDGTFELVGVRNGSWVLMAQVREPGAMTPLMGAAAVEVRDRDVEGVEVRISDGIKLEGRLVAEGLPQAPQWKGFMAQLVPAEQISYGWMQTQPVREDGSFSLVASLPGKYMLQVNGPAPAGAYLDSVKMGGQEYLGRELDLNEATVGPVQVTYRAGGGNLRIDVGGQAGGQAGAMRGVLLVPKAVELRKRPFLLFRPVGSTGFAVFTGLRPGEYLAVAVANADYNTMMQGDIPKELLAAAVTLKVGANGTAQVALTPVPMPAR